MEGITPREIWATEGEAMADPAEDCSGGLGGLWVFCCRGGQGMGAGLKARGGSSGGGNWNGVWGAAVLDDLL